MVGGQMQNVLWEIKVVDIPRKNLFGGTKMEYKKIKTLKKIILSAVEVAIAGGAIVYSGNSYWISLVPLLEGLRNVLKHKWGIGKNIL